LDVPTTIKNNCRKPNGFGYPENNNVTILLKEQSIPLKISNGFGMTERVLHLNTRN